MSLIYGIVLPRLQLSNPKYTITIQLTIWKLRVLNKPRWFRNDTYIYIPHIGIPDINSPYTNTRFGKNKVFRLSLKCDRNKEIVINKAQWQIYLY
jgi:hypothetical protein